MRKTVMGKGTARAEQRQWLDLEQIASVEVTSEDPAFPVEGVFSEDESKGWRAAEPGEQMIRIVFDEPQSIRRMQLEFSEPGVERTQEFLLRWTASDGNMREIVRQRWNFSPQGSTVELEDYTVELPAASTLELIVTPDLTNRTAVASLRRWRVA